MSFAHLLNRARDENVLNSVLLELTYRCDLDCTFCYNDTKLRGRKLELGAYKSLLDDLAAMDVMSLLLSGGEPLLYPHFFELGAHARKRGFVIKVKSNGMPLNEGNARRLKEEVDPIMVEVSIHGAAPESHDRQTRVPGSFERLLKNVEILVSHGLRVKLNSALTRWNENEVGEMFALADSMDVLLQFDPVVTPRDDGAMAPLAIAASKEGIKNMVRISTQRSRVARLHDKRLNTPEPGSLMAQAGERKKQKVCGAGSTNLIVDPYGQVYPCVQFRRCLGNIHDQSINEIWNGSGELNRVRDLAGRAQEVALGSGLNQFCMGINELCTGDPLKSPESKLEIDRIYQDVHRKSDEGSDAA
jgi:radical SAM protein with 4Fe4S-binding SPASM domain